MQSYSLEFKPSLVDDFAFIYDSIQTFSGSKEEAKYVLKALKESILQLKNPYLSGSLPYSRKIKERGFLQYVVLNGSYLIFFKNKKKEQKRIIYYLKNTRMDYQYLIV